MNRCRISSWVPTTIIVDLLMCLLFQEWIHEVGLAVRIAVSWGGVFVDASSNSRLK